MSNIWKVMIYCNNKKKISYTCFIGNACKKILTIPKFIQLPDHNGILIYPLFKLLLF